MSDKQAIGCACAGCPVERCPGREGDEGESSLRGRRLVLAALVSFLAPVALAIVGGMIAGRTGEAQLGGALAGLAIGMVGACLLARRAGRGEGRAETAERLPIQEGGAERT